MKKYKVGDEVDDPALGHGVVVRTNVCGVPHWYSVLWDDRPPMQYNMGENPCLWLPGVHKRGNGK